MYKFCFHNPDSTPETVSFYIHVGHIPGEHDLAKDDHLDPVNVKIADLREALESVTAEQKYLKLMRAQGSELYSTRLESIFCLPFQVHSKSFISIACLANGLPTIEYKGSFEKWVGNRFYFPIEGMGIHS